MIFNFSQDYILEDEVICLLPLRISHVHELAKISADEDIWTYFFEKGFHLHELTDYVKAAEYQRKSGKEYPFVVYDKINQKYVGCTRMYDIMLNLKTIKIGHTWYGKDYRGKGINKRCKYLLFEFAFEQLAMERIGFGAYRDNEVSIAAMKSVGCSVEGILRNAFPSRDGKGRADGVILSILKAEWNRKVKMELKEKINYTSI